MRLGQSHIATLLLSCGLATNANAAQNDTVPLSQGDVVPGTSTSENRTDIGGESISDVDLYGLRIGMDSTSVVAVLNSRIAGLVPYDRRSEATKLAKKTLAGTYTERRRDCVDVSIQAGTCLSTISAINFIQKYEEHNINIRFIEDFGSNPGTSYAQSIKFENDYVSSSQPLNALDMATKKYGAPHRSDFSIKGGSDGRRGIFTWDVNSEFGSSTIILNTKGRGYSISWTLNPEIKRVLEDKQKHAFEEARANEQSPF